MTKLNPKSKSVYIAKADREEAVVGEAVTLPTDGE